MKLKALEIKDLEKIKQWRNEQMYILRQSKPLTMHNQVEWYKKISTDPNQRIFGIVDKFGDLIGYCGFVYIDWKNKHAEMSMVFKTKKATDMVLHKEAINLLLRIAFESLNLNKIYVEYYDLREEDYGIMIQDMGFHNDGILRQHNYEGGEYQNSNIYSILKKEWIKQQK